MPEFIQSLKYFWNSLFVITNSACFLSSVSSVLRKGKSQRSPKRWLRHNYGFVFDHKFTNKHRCVRWCVIMHISCLKYSHYFLHYFNVLIGYWCVQTTRTTVAIDIFSAFLKQVILNLNLCSAYSRFVKHHILYLKCSWTFNFIFYPKLNTHKIWSIFSKCPPKHD